MMTYKEGLHIHTPASKPGEACMTPAVLRTRCPTEGDDVDLLGVGVIGSGVTRVARCSPCQQERCSRIAHGNFQTYIYAQLRIPSCRPQFRESQMRSNHRMGQLQMGTRHRSRVHFFHVGHMRQMHPWPTIPRRSTRPEATRTSAWLTRERLPQKER